MRAVLTVSLILAVSGPAHAGKIENACLLADRSMGQRALCRCIQDAADLTLSSRDQKLAASFFADPHRAQEIRQSDSRRHEAFWDRYEHFGRVAEAYCRR